MRKSGSPAEWERVRNIAANMLDEGKEPVEIARMLKIDAQTVRKWRRMYQKEGRAGLASGKSPGRPRALSDSALVKLESFLLKTPKECGFERYLWTQQVIADLIEREFGVSCHHDHVGRILKRMGFTHQKPMRRARERDEVKIEAWRKEAWPAILKKVLSPGA